MYMSVFFYTPFLVNIKCEWCEWSFIQRTRTATPTVTPTFVRGHRSISEIWNINYWHLMETSQNVKYKIVYKASMPLQKTNTRILLHKRKKYKRKSNFSFVFFKNFFLDTVTMLIENHFYLHTKKVFKYSPLLPPGFTLKPS